MELIKKYFPALTTDQLSQLEQLFPLYQDWNAKINLVSRKDIDALNLHHILHSLSIAKYIQFKPKSKVMDLGTGGGFPGIPLAILFPETEFVLVDSIGKKINVVRDIAEKIGLTNVRAYHERAENIKENFDFIVTRAVTDLKTLMFWSSKKVNSQHQHAVPNGLIALKGPTWAAERKELSKKEFVEAFSIYKWFPHPFFEEKYLVYIQMG